jgi:hypothetical protein
MGSMLTAAGLWTCPAGATQQCPDDEDAWHPNNCDLVLPIDPNQPHHECSFEAWWAWHTTGKGMIPFACRTGKPRGLGS